MQSFQQYRRGGYDDDDDDDIAPGWAADGGGGVPLFKKWPNSCSAVSSTSTATGRSESLMLVLYWRQLAQIRRTSVAKAATDAYAPRSSLEEMVCKSIGCLILAR
jgi:hypothetical protein